MSSSSAYKQFNITDKNFAKRNKHKTKKKLNKNHSPDRINDLNIVEYAKEKQDGYSNNEHNRNKIIISKRRDRDLMITTQVTSQSTK